MQAALRACGRLLSGDDAEAHAADAGDGGGEEPQLLTAAAEVAPRATYATALAMTAIQRVGGRAPSAVLAAVVPLHEVVRMVAQTQAAVPRGREAGLQVLVMALRGAALPDITATLPAIMSLAFSGGAQVRLCFDAGGGGRCGSVSPYAIVPRRAALCRPLSTVGCEPGEPCGRISRRVRGA